MSSRERAALKKLKNSTTVIRIQDKGSRFVLINSVDYEEKVLGQLQNDLHHKPLHSDPTAKHVFLVEKWCSKWLQKGKISPKIADWVNNKKAKPGIAFGNV